MVTRFLAVVVVCFFIQGCASSSNKQNNVDNITAQSTVVSENNGADSELSQEEVEEKSKQSGFKCLIGKIASGIL